MSEPRGPYSGPPPADGPWQSGGYIPPGAGYPAQTGFGPPARKPAGMIWVLLTVGIVIAVLLGVVVGLLLGGRGGSEALPPLPTPTTVQTSTSTDPTPPPGSPSPPATTPAPQTTRRSPTSRPSTSRPPSSRPPSSRPPSSRPPSSRPPSSRPPSSRPPSTSGPPSTSPPTTSTPSPSAVVVDIGRGLSVTLPAGWRVDEQQPDVVVVTNGQAYVTLQAFQPSSRVTADVIMAGYIEQMKSTFSSASVDGPAHIDVGPKGTGSVAVISGTRSSSSGSLGVVVAATIVVRSADGVSLLVAMLTHPADWDAVVPDYKTMRDELVGKLLS